MVTQLIDIEGAGLVGGLCLGPHHAVSLGGIVVCLGQTASGCHSGCEASAPGEPRPPVSSLCLQTAAGFCLHPLRPTLLSHPVGLTQQGGTRPHPAGAQSCVVS